MSGIPREPRLILVMSSNVALSDVSLMNMSSTTGKALCDAGGLVWHITFCYMYILSCVFFVCEYFIIFWKKKYRGVIDSNLYTSGATWEASD